MPLFMVKREYFDFYRSGEKDVELRVVRPQWKNTNPGDEAVIMCGGSIMRKKILKVHKGSLARIFREVDYKPILPKASTIFEAMKATKELCPEAEDFMAFEISSS